MDADSPVSRSADRTESTWLITANVVKERPYGPGGQEARGGTKHFRGGAKIYIIGAHWGMCESVTVIGHHRHSGRFARLDMRKRHLENLRLTVCYSPTVIAMVADEYRDQLPTKDYWEEKLAVIASWPDH